MYPKLLTSNNIDAVVKKYEDYTWDIQAAK